MKIKIFFFVIFLFFSPIVYILYDTFSSTSVVRGNVYGVIYGNTVFLDGTSSPRLQARLHAGKELYDNSIIKTIIVSGGIGKEWQNEAEVMKNFFVQNGIPEEKIIVDSDGYTTRQSSENVFKIISKKEKSIQDTSVVGISQWFHVPRVVLSLKQAWFEEVSGYAPIYFELRDIYSLVREILAYLKYYFEDRD